MGKSTLRPNENSRRGNLLKPNEFFPKEKNGKPNIEIE